MNYTQLRNTVLDIRRRQLRAKVAKSVAKLDSTDVEVIRCDTLMSRPAILRALDELGYDTSTYVEPTA
jgi:hypothetical protein